MIMFSAILFFFFSFPWSRYHGSSSFQVVQVNENELLRNLIHTFCFFIGDYEGVLVGSAGITLNVAPN